MNHTLITCLIAAFFAWMLFIGYRTHLARTKTLERENFLIGNRGIIGWMMGIGAFMGWVDAFLFSYVGSLGYDMGWGALWFMLGDIAGFVVLIWFAATLRKHAAKHNAYMMGNWFSALSSPRCAALVGIAMALFMYMWMLMQFVVGGQVLVGLTGISLGVVVVAMGLVTLAYMLLGGFMASIKTDLAQFLVFMAFFIFLPFQLPPVQQWAPPLSTLTATPFLDQLSLFILAFVSSVITPDLWQRIYSAKSEQQATRGITYMAIGITVIYVFCIALGMVVKSLNVIPDSSTVAPAIFQHVVPGWLMPLAVLGFMAAIMSTAATLLFGSAMALASDVGVELKWLAKPKLETAARWLMLILMPLTFYLTLSGLNVTTLALGIMGVSCVPYPFAQCLLLGIKLNERAAFYSMLLALIFFLGGVTLGLFTGILALLPLIVATGTLLLFEGLSRKR